MTIVKIAGPLGITILIGYGLSAPPAQAAFVETFEQVGSSVIETGSGTLNVDGLFSSGTFGESAELYPMFAISISGAPGSETAYRGLIIGPGTFGTGGAVRATSGVGDSVGIEGSVSQGTVLGLPEGYVSGTTSLLTSATYANQSFSSLGIDPGSYTWTWGGGGSGTTADSFTLDIGVAAPPPPVDEPSALFDMGIGLAALAFAATWRRHGSVPSD